MKSAFRALLFVVALGVAAYGQSALTTTTLSNAISASATQFVIASATGVSASNSTNRYIFVIEKEAMDVVAISGTSVTVKRGIAGTHADAHIAGESVYWIDAKFALTAEPSGACTAANVGVNPKPLLNTSKLFFCSGGSAGGKWYEVGGSGGFYVEALFCGDQQNNTTGYESPITGYGGGNFYTGGLTANDLDYSLAGTGCAAEDSTTEATADEVMFPNNDAIPVGLYCTVNSSGSNGVTFSLRDDAADLSPTYSLTIATLKTSAATWRKTSAVIAAGSTVALKTVDTENLSASDNWCVARFQLFPNDAP